jgi:hypothetical protein
LFGVFSYSCGALHLWYNKNMAQYKVPQDVEADDKLIGPFSFRQFVYLLIAAALIALAVGLFQIFPLLAIIPVLPVLLLITLALPLKKDQPMETYLAAIVSYYLKPRKRLWIPGQRESTIKITAPKIVDEHRTRDITEEEATHRLSFLADIMDTGGYAIKGYDNQTMRDDLVAEADSAEDIFENHRFENLENTISKDENNRHEEIMKEMREAIDKSELMDGGNNEIKKGFPNEAPISKETEQPRFDSPVVVLPNTPEERKPVEKTNVVEKAEKGKDKTIKAKPSIIELANNPDFSIATISKEAKRIKEREEGEVFISLQ